MIICYQCQRELKEYADFYQCDFCGFQAHKKNGIIFFDPELSRISDDYDKEDLDILYRAENNFFWLRSRKDFIKNLFHKYVAKTDKIIEIGAGTGNIAQALLSDGYDVTVGEIYENGIRYSQQRGIKKAYQFDVKRLPFKEHFDVVGMFDVLEHLDNDDLVLRNIRQALKMGGKAIITVPAHKKLWNYNDVLARHKRRYELKELKNIFLKNGFEIITAKNFFVFILPLLYVRAVLNRNSSSSLKNQNVMATFKINSIIGGILFLMLKLENKLLKHVSPSFGGSIAIVARKI